MPSKKAAENRKGNVSRISKGSAIKSRKSTISKKPEAAPATLSMEPVLANDLRTCKQCRKQYQRKPSGSEYCSKECAHAWVRNNAFSFKTKPPWQK